MNRNANMRMTDSRNRKLSVMCGARDGWNNGHERSAEINSKNELLIVIAK